jgi:hypothetical protein
LAARPPPVDDKLLRDAPPHVRAAVVLDRGDRQIDARRNPPEVQMSPSRMKRRSASSITFG